jgi:protein phosphatase
MTLQVRYAIRSHTGLLRTSNEDSGYAGPRLLAVADGMGGHAAGEVASAVVIAALAGLDADLPGQDLLTPLVEHVETANTQLRAMTERDPALAGMGTTLVALLFDRSRVGLLHIGDSRVYLLRSGELTQITHDHTLVQTLIDEGRLTEEAAQSHPQRSVITKVLDGREDVQPDLAVREVVAGDRYLLCSDGLTGPVASNDTLRDALALPDRQEACDRLVQLALRGGGPDNITVAVVDVVESDDPEQAPAIVGAATEQAPDEGGLATGPAARAQVAEGRDTPAPRRFAVTVEKPRRRRTAVAAVLVTLVLAGTGFATFAYVRSQYYVGIEGEQVVVYRGVPGSVAGLDLAGVQARTTLRADRLPEIERQRVEDGIVATDERDALAIVQRLIATTCEIVPVLPRPETTATPSPSPSERGPCP